MNRLVLFSTLAAAAIAAALYGAARKHADASAAPSFRTAIVERGEITQRVTASGTLSALTTVTVGSQVSGNIAKLHVDYNAAVTAGQLLAEIEPSTYQARLVQAEADLLSTQATLELKQLSARRLADLLAQALVPQSEYDQAAAELRQQEALTRKSEAAVENARVDLARCKITSPIDGVVLSRAVDVGQTVQASFSAPTLFTLAQDLRQMQITANISEADVGGVSAGVPATFTVDAFPGRTFRGVVREVRNNATTTNNVVTYPTIILVENADLKLRPGMTANVTLTTAHRNQVLRVPNAALRFRVPVGTAVRPATPAASAAPAVGAPTEPSLEQLPAELRARLVTEFDQNADGSLDAAEQTVMRTTQRARFASGARPPSPPPESAPKGAATDPARPAPTEAATPAAVQTRTLYVLAAANGPSAAESPELTATPVEIGLADTAYTEIVSGLNEGDAVVTGTRAAGAAVASSAASTNGTTNPFAPARPPAGGPPPR